MKYRSICEVELSLNPKKKYVSSSNKSTGVRCRIIRPEVFNRVACLKTFFKVTGTHL